MKWSSSVCWISVSSWKLTAEWSNAAMQLPVSTIKNEARSAIANNVHCSSSHLPNPPLATVWITGSKDSRPSIAFSAQVAIIHSESHEAFTIPIRSPMSGLLVCANVIHVSFALFEIIAGKSCSSYQDVSTVDIMRNVGMHSLISTKHDEKKRNDFNCHFEGFHCSAHWSLLSWKLENARFLYRWEVANILFDLFFQLSYQLS